MSGHHQLQGRDPLEGYRVLKIGLSPNREALYARLNTRCETMFASGLLDEVRSILDRGYSPACKPFESHGYKQALQLLNGQLSLPEALYHAKQNTRRYAKRQWTWYSRESGVQWFGTFGTESPTREEALARVRDFLRSPENN
jgi:tRNA dimethylallyltransferase